MDRIPKPKRIDCEGIFKLWIKTTYQLNQKFICPDFVQYLILLLSKLQPYYFINRVSKEDNTIYAIYEMLIRPDLILIDFQYFNSQEYIILLITLAIQKVAFSILCYINKNHESFFQKYILQNAGQYFLQLLIYYQQFLGLYLIQPITSIFIEKINNTFQIMKSGETTSIAIIMVSCIGLIFYLIDNFFFFKIASHPTTYKVQKCKQFMISNFDFIIMKINLVQIVFGQQHASITIKQAQAILLWATSLLQIYHQTRNCSYIYYLQKHIFIICNSILILSSALSLLTLFDVEEKSFRFLFLIVLPLIINLFLIYQEQQDNQYYILMFKKQNYKELQNNLYQSLYQLVRILNSCESLKQHKNFKQSLIYNSHIQKCQKLECSCQLDYNITENSQINAITVFMFNEFMKKQYKLLVNRLLFNTMKNSHKQDLLVSIAIILYDFNQMMISLQILSQLRKIEQSAVINLNFLKEFLNQKCRKLSEETILRISLTSIEKVQINLVLISARMKFEANLGTSLRAAKQTLIKQFLEEFLCNQTNQQEIIKGMQRCTKMKISFYEMLDSDSGYTINYLFFRIKEICKQLLHLEQRLKYLFNQSPDLQMQRVFCFFESQIMNNLLAAFNIQQIDLMIRENQTKYHSIKELNLSAEVNAYQILSINENFMTLTIEHSSQNFSKLFGISFDISQHHFLDLIPPYFSKLHDASVQTFFHTGQNKFYRNFNSTFISTYNGLLRPVTLSIDNTHIFKHDKFIFAAFIQSKDSDGPILVVDAVNQITYFTFEILKQFGLNEQHQKQMLEESILHQIGVLTIIPYFNQLVKNDMFSEILTTFCFFLKPDYNANPMTLTSFSVRNNPNYFIWRNKDNINCFTCEFRIEKILLNNCSYVILEFLSIKLITVESERKKLLDIYSPFLGDNSIHKGSKWKGKSLKIMSILSFRTERKRTTFKQQQSQAQKGTSNQINNLNQSSFVQNNQSQSNLLTSRNKNEQEFFKSFNRSFVESEIQISQLDKVEVQQAEKKEQNQEINQSKFSQKAERAAPQQQSSSLAGIYRPFFYNRFSLLEKMTRKKNPKKIDFFLFFFIGQSLIFFIFSILVMVNMTKDMSQITSNIAMVSLHASVMGPHDLFYQMRVTISSYQQMQREGFLSQNETNTLVEPFYDNIQYGFSDLEDSYYQLFQNGYLQQFFNEMNLDLRYMDQNSGQLITIQTSFRESLIVTLSYQYNAMKTIQQRSSTSGQPFQIFLLANYFLLHDQTEIITINIHEWLNLTSSSILSKGIIFWIVLQCLLILFCAVGLFNFHQYMKYYDQFLLIFNEFNKQQIYQQLNKYDHIYQLISQHQDDLTKYNFDNELHQQERTSSQYGRGNLHHFKLLNRSRQQLSRFNVYSIIIIITFVYLIYTSIINYKQQSFQSKYEDTTAFYKLIQDLKLKSGSIYLFKEIFLRWNNYTFLTINERQQLQSYVDSSHELIRSYILISSAYDQSFYLITDTFSNKFNSLKSENICDEIQANLQEFMLFYCDKSFEGTLEKGLIQSLNYISNAIESQQEINNFTTRVEVQLYEQEGSQILTRVFFILSDLFDESIAEAGRNINQFLILFSLGYLLLSIFLIILTQQEYRKYLINEYHQIRMSLYLIPKESILYDESLERYLREIELSQGLI